MIIKNQVLLIVSSLSVKKIQGKLWTNKAAITKMTCSMFHRKWEQSPSQLWCQKSKRNSNDKVEWKHSYWKKKHLLNWEALKPTGFESSPKCPASYPSLHHLVVSSLHRQLTSQVAWLSLTFSYKKEHLLEIKWFTVERNWGRADEWKELKHDL